MDVGFETIGNATLICYDKKPIIVTDPWIEGSPYFGSWTLSHEIPLAQRDAILQCEYVWVSHGHPDHLNSDSIKLLKGKKILLPNHYGGRIYEALKGHGHDVHTLEDKVWYKISDRIRILCLSDFNQDASLLIDVNGRLIVNCNDTPAYGWMGFIRRTVKQYSISFYLRLYGGKADMLNYFDEGGNRIPLRPKDTQLGRRISWETDHLGTKYFIPFSSFHKMQREDSVWLQPWLPDLSNFARGFDSTTSEILPPFLSYDCSQDKWQRINPRPTPDRVRNPRDFGDDWDDLLEKSDLKKAQDYFWSFEHLSNFLDFICLRVGKKDFFIDIGDRKFDRGITFEAPRNSLMCAINNEIFDGLLIGNFMKVTLHGKWPIRKLYPEFTPYLAKYGDNGQAKTRKDLARYFREYHRRMGPSGVLERVQANLELQSKDVFRAMVSEDAWILQTARSVYHNVRKA